MHGPDDRDVVHPPGQMGHDLGDPGTRLTVLGELEGTAQQPAGLLRRRHIHGDLVEVGLSMMLVQHRLGIQQVHGAGAAIHEQQDDRLGLGLEVGLSGSDIIDTAAAETERTGFVRQTGHAQQVPRQQVGQSHPVDAVGDPPEKMAAGHGLR